MSNLSPEITLALKELAEIGEHFATISKDFSAKLKRVSEILDGLPPTAPTSDYATRQDLQETNKNMRTLADTTTKKIAGPGGVEDRILRLEQRINELASTIAGMQATPMTRETHISPVEEFPSNPGRAIPIIQAKPVTNDIVINNVPPTENTSPAINDSAPAKSNTGMIHEDLQNRVDSFTSRFNEMNINNLSRFTLDQEQQSALTESDSTYLNDLSRIVPELTLKPTTSVIANYEGEFLGQFRDRNDELRSFFAVSIGSSFLRSNEISAALIRQTGISVAFDILNLEKLNGSSFCAAKLHEAAIFVKSGPQDNPVYHQYKKGRIELI